MKVLWITNILFPDICEKLGKQAPVTGGWMKSSAQAILDLNENLELAVATLYDGNILLKEVINRVTYYCLPHNIYVSGYNPEVEKSWIRVEDDFHPDVVHIHGTEFTHGLAYMRAVGTQKVVVSIQGLVGAYARYSLGQIPVSTLKKHLTIYDILKGHILNMPDRMEKQGLWENEYLRFANHIIGRTDWDRSHVWAVNPNATYHFCNETLRAPFYTTEWELDNCEKHTIFLSQAQKPIKGIHKVIEALPFIIREFSDVKVYVAGTDFTLRKTWKDRLKFSTYAGYVSHLMAQYHVEDRFVFTGLLDENQMAKRYQQAHVFVCPSSIENSPNSLGEAQLVGTPVVSSYVGGVPNMLRHEETGLMYRFEEHEMLAKCICRIFSDDDLAVKISKEERKVAVKRHSSFENAMRTVNIYREIANE